MSRREAKEILNALDKLAFQEVVEQARGYLEGSSIPLAEDWEPYPDPEEIEREEIPPFYSTIREAEEAARRAARKKPASLHE